MPAARPNHERRQWYARTNQKLQTLWSSALAAFKTTLSPSQFSVTGIGGRTGGISVPRS